MVFNNNYPYNVIPQYQIQLQPQVQQNNNGLIWVQGEAGAKSYQVLAGQSVLLMDSESNVFYIKSSDASGMPMPLRIFDYTERNNDKIDTQVDYVTREEFEKTIAEIKNAKQSVQSAKPKQFNKQSFRND